MHLSLISCSGRCIVLKCRKSCEESENSFQVLNDLLAVNEALEDAEKPFDFLIQGPVYDRIESFTQGLERPIFGSEI